MGNKPQCCCSEKTKAGDFNMGVSKVKIKLPPKESFDDSNIQMMGKTIESKFQNSADIDKFPPTSSISKPGTVIEDPEQQIKEQKSRNAGINQNGEQSVLGSFRKNSGKGSNISSFQQKGHEQSKLHKFNLEKTVSQGQFIYTQKNEVLYKLDKSYLDPNSFLVKQRVNDYRVLGVHGLTPQVRQTFQKTKFFIVEDLKKKPVNYQRVPDGFWKYVKKDGSLYIGPFVDGQAHGRGVYIFADGSYYEGMFRNDKAQTYGNYCSKNMTYKGDFKNNKFDGKGVERGLDYIYSGTFSDGERVKGVLQWTQGKTQYTYKGSFKDGKFDGQGHLTEPFGTYQGSFKNGLKQGQGVYQYKNGYKYKGSYVKSVRQGQGTLISPIKTILFKGYFLEGLPVTQNKEVTKINTALVKSLQSGQFLLQD